MKMGDAGRTVLDKAGDTGRWVIESIFGGEDEAEGESAAQVIEEITVKLNDIARRVISTTDSNGLSRAQQAAVDEKPFLLRMQMGTNVHLQIFEEAQADEFLMSQIRIAPQGTSMPDFVHKTLNVGWEITTENQWSAHISKYPSDDWGPMIGILYRFL